MAPLLSPIPRECSAVSLCVAANPFGKAKAHTLASPPRDVKESAKKGENMCAINHTPLVRDRQGRAQEAVASGLPSDVPVCQSKPCRIDDGRV